MNTQTYEEASEWCVEFRAEEVGVATKQRFEAWLASSPENVRAYLELSAVWEEVSAIDQAHSADVDALTARAQAASNIVPLSIAQPQPKKRAATARRLLPLAASFVLIAVLIGAAVWIQQSGDDYTTGIGEQRSILLGDGSTVELNARSKIRVDYGADERAIELVQGQALFRVAKEKNRPFIVRAGDAGVRAVGTEFDVYRRSANTIVTVLEGKVAVLKAGQGAELTAGEQVVLAPRTIAQPKPANIPVATAWTRRRLIFESTPLMEVAEEFNRYSQKQLFIQTQGLEDFHISGAFSSSDPQALLRFLRAQEALNVDERSDRIVITHR